MPKSPLTVAEAETLAVMLESAGHKMAKVQVAEGRYAWPWPVGYEAMAEMFAGFYAIAPMGVYI